MTFVFHYGFRAFRLGEEATPRGYITRLTRDKKNVNVCGAISYRFFFFA